MNAHRVDMFGDKPTVISTFAGTGGSSLGYHWAGYKELLAIDWEDHAVECFRKNFPDVPCWQRDITTVSGKEILDFTGLKPGELDVFDGSPPCQGFSTAGKRNVNDNRNTLFESYVSLVQSLQPKFLQILANLKSLNYQVKCKQMNAMYYGVPQSRQRVIFIGIRNDLKKEPVFPLPSLDIITVKEALVDVQNKTFPPDMEKHKEAIRYIKSGKGFKECAPKNILLKFAPRMVNNTTFSFNGCGRRLLLNRPSPTITKTWIAFAEPPVHPTEHRFLTIEEALRLCSFPDSWQLGSDYKSAWSRLGNAVMPKFMQAIAETIKTEILQKAG